ILLKSRPVVCPLPSCVPLLPRRINMQNLKVLFGMVVAIGLVTAAKDEEKAGPNDNMPPPGFTALFNGKDLTNWQGLVELPDRKKLTAEQLAAKQEEANKKYLPHWTVKNGVLNYDGHGQSLQTAKDYGNFEMYVD